MPLEDYHYEKILDDIYETASEGEDEYFSDDGETPWAVGAIAKLPVSQVQPSEPVRFRRKKAQKITKLQLKIQNQMDAAENSSKTEALPRLPTYIPPFSETSASELTVTLPVQPKPLKRWQSSAAAGYDQPSTSGGAKSKSKNSMPSASAEDLPRWSVDESDMSILDLDRPSIRKYNEFKAAVIRSNCSPVDTLHFVDSARWHLKRTKQKDGYKLYRIKLVGQYRAAFLIDNEKRKVMMMTASPHES